MAWHPTFGLNTTYIGGNFRRGAFPTPPGGSTQSNFAVGYPRPMFYVKNLSDVRNPDRMMVFSSSRSVDIMSAGRGSDGYGGQPVPFQAGRPIVPGAQDIQPPLWTNQSWAGTFTNWVTSNKFDPNAAPKDWGQVDARHFGKAVTIMFDGHIEMKKIEQMRDMRIWANQAKSATWNFGQ
jgi:hypothetical protein